MTRHDTSPDRACKDFEADLILYYYGDCAEADRLRVETHVRSCPACARFLQALREILPLTAKADEPPESFWLDYTRELRGKLVAAEENVPWWKRFFVSHRWWPVPALATALVVILALTLTFNKRSRRPAVIPPEDEAFLEVLPMAENLEFFKVMELLDALDFLEASGGLGSGSA